MEEISLPKKTSVLIAGAGPSGMTAALALRRAGADVVIVDKRPHTREHSQAAILWPRTLEILDLLGIVEDWAPHTTTINAFTLTIDDHPATLDLHPANSPHPKPQGVGQDITEALLEARVKKSGAQLLRPAEVLHVDLREDGVQTRLRVEDGSEQTIESDWIIGCEGSQSPVRDAAGIQRTGSKNSGVQIVQGDVKIRGPLALEPGRGYLWSDADRKAMFIMPAHVDGHYRVLVTVPDDGVKDAPTLEHLEGLVQQFLPGVELFEPSWLNRYRTQHQIADTYRAGRALLAGDSAHIWVPVGGQGMNVGMQDAFDIGWKLGEVVAGRFPPELLDTYTPERRPLGKRTISDTERMYGALLDPQSVQAMIRRKLIPMALGLHSFESLAMERFAEVDLEYPASSIVVDHGHTDGPKAGERAPNAWVTQEDRTVRLYDLYRFGKWLVLGWAISENDDTAIEALEAVNGNEISPILIDGTRHGLNRWKGQRVRDMGRIAAQAFGVTKGSVHVIRPDGVIGYRGGVAIEPLLKYLTSFTARP